MSNPTDKPRGESPAEPKFEPSGRAVEYMDGEGVARRIEVWFSLGRARCVIQLSSMQPGEEPVTSALNIPSHMASAMAHMLCETSHW